MSKKKFDARFSNVRTPEELRIQMLGVMAGLQQEIQQLDPHLQQAMPVLLQRDAGITEALLALLRFTEPEEVMGMLKAIKAAYAAESEIPELDAVGTIRAWHLGYVLLSMPVSVRLTAQAMREASLLARGKADA